MPVTKFAIHIWTGNRTEWIYNFSMDKKKAKYWTEAYKEYQNYMFL